MLGKLRKNNTPGNGGALTTSHRHEARRNCSPILVKMSFSERPVSPVRRLLPYFHRHRRSLALGFGCILATTAIQLLSPWVLKFAVDDLTTGVTRAKLLYYAVVLFAIALVGGVFRFLMRKVVIGVSRHMEYDLRNDFFRHLQRLPPAFYQERRTGDLMSRATNDLNAVRMMAGPSVMYATQTTLVFVVAIILMVSIDPWLTMVALLPLPFVSVSVKVFGTAIHRRFERIQEQLSELSAVAQENLSGVRVVRAYGQERAELEKFRVGQPGVHRAQPRADSPPGRVLPQPDAAARPGGAAGAVAGKPRGDCRPHHAWASWSRSTRIW